MADYPTSWMQCASALCFLTGSIWQCLIDGVLDETRIWMHRSVVWMRRSRGASDISVQFVRFKGHSSVLTMGWIFCTFCGSWWLERVNFDEWATPNQYILCCHLTGYNWFMMLLIDGGSWILKVAVLRHLRFLGRHYLELFPLTQHVRDGLYASVLKPRRSHESQKALGVVNLLDL